MQKQAENTKINPNESHPITQLKLRETPNKIPR